MFRGNLMERTDNCAFEQAECRFDGVRVNVATHVFSSSVLDGFVRGVGVSDTKVSGPFVRHDALGAALDVLADESVQFLPTVGGALADAKLTAPLNRGEHHRLVPLVAFT